MGKGTNYIATNLEIAQKAGYSTSSVTNPSYLCTNARALTYGGYSPVYASGKDNYCTKYTSIYACGTNTTSNCTINITTTRDSSCQRVVATATANSGYDMTSLTLQSSGGTTIQTVTTAPFQISWIPNQNFKFTASATPQITYQIRYVSSDNRVVYPSVSSPFDVAITDNQYYGTYGIMTLSGDPTVVNSNAFLNCQNLQSITIPDTVTTIDNNAFQTCPALTSIQLSSGLRDIYSFVFAGCYNLTSINIPASVRYIYNNIFAGCYNLATITVDSNNSTFDSRNNCNAIIKTASNEIFSGCKNTVIPNTITTIGDGAFGDITSLTSISIPSSVQTINPSAFYNCSGLTTITIPSSVTTIGNNAFRECSNLTEIECVSNTPANIGTNVFINTNNCPIYVPGPAINTYKTASNWSSYQARITARIVQTINYTTYNGIEATIYDASAFGSAVLISNTYVNGQGNLNFDRDVSTFGYYVMFQSNLSSISLPSSVTYIDYAALAENDYLTTVTMPGVVDISTNAFITSPITSVTLPSTLHTIGNNAFQMTALTSLTIPRYVSNIGTGICGGCNSLTTITVDSNNAYYDSRNSCKAIIKKSNNTLIQGCKNTTIPSSVTAIGDAAFTLFSTLTTISIPSSVTSIGSAAFQYCTGLTNITLPSALTTIGSHGFNGCTSLTSITIPASVTNMGQTAFKDCSSLTKITCVSNTPATIGTYIFDNTNNCPIYVPGTAVNTYKSAPIWSNYQARIQAGVMQTINYTTSDNQRATVYNPNGFGSAVLLSNNYDTTLHKGTLNFDRDVSMFGYVAMSGSNLASITLPSTVTDISTSAFAQCNDLSNITMPGVTTLWLNCFQECAFQSITLPTTLTTIGDFVFEGNLPLTSLTIPRNVSSIGYAICSVCVAISSLVVDGNNPYYDSRNNCNAIIRTSTNTIVQGSNNTVIPSTVTTIGALSFSYLTGLTSITIPANVTTIDSSAFYYANAMTSITCESTTPPTLTGTNTFDYTNNCPIYVPASAVNTYKAASGWSSYQARITAIVASSELKIGSSQQVDPTTWAAEEWGAAVQSVTYDSTNSLTIIAFNGNPTMIAAYAFEGNQYIEYIDTWPSTITSIEKNAFAYSSIESVRIPTSISYIGQNAFEGCVNLTDVIFDDPSAVDRIDDYAFNGCEVLETITIPASVTYIGNYAFDQCGGLQEMIFEGTTPPELGENALHGDYPIIVPAGCTQAYAETKGWENYVDRIIEFVPKMKMASKSQQKPTTQKGWGAEISKIEYDKDAMETIITFADNPTTIPASAYNKNTDITEITLLPDTITSIGEAAFLGCTGLTTLTIPSNITQLDGVAFANCTNLNEIIIESTVPAKLGEGVFENTTCNIYVPEGTADLYKKSSGWSEYADRITEGGEVTTKMELMGKGQIQTKVTEGWGATISNQSYDEKTGISTITFSGEPTTVPTTAFTDNTTLTNIVSMPSSITTISDSAFINCTQLVSLIMPSALTIINANAFANCPQLTSLTLPSTVTQIGAQAFAKCPGLTEINIESDTPATLGDNVFNGSSCYIYVPKGTLETYLKDKAWYVYRDRLKEKGSDTYTMQLSGKEQIVPKDTENWGAKITDQSYDKSTSITTITFDSAPTTIPKSAFTGNEGLMEIIAIPSSITIIAATAFSWCTGITSLTIPSTIATIGNYAFANCSSLQSITVESSTPATIGSYVFEDTNKCPIYVPEKSVETYQKSAGWAEYSNRIQAKKS